MTDPRDERTEDEPQPAAQPDEDTAAEEGDEEDDGTSDEPIEGADEEAPADVRDGDVGALEEEGL